MVSQDINENQNFDLNKHLENTVAQYCEGMSDEDKSKLLDRITCDEGNKKYKTNDNRTDDESKHKVDKDGQKTYELEELAKFPNLEKDFPTERAYPLDNKEHKEGVAKANVLLESFRSGDSKVAQDLDKLLKNSHITFRVRSNWDTPNGNCSFKKAEKKGEKNEIIICICDLSKTGDKVLPGILAHELGHTLEFSQRPKGTETMYMDGAETAADIIGAGLAVNAGYDPRPFGDYMGKHHEDNKANLEKEPMLYTPDGSYRKTNLNSAYEIMKNAKHNKMSNSADKIKDLRGLSASAKAPYKSRPISRESLKGIRYAPTSNNGR